MGYTYGDNGKYISDIGDNEEDRDNSTEEGNQSTRDMQVKRGLGTEKRRGDRDRGRVKVSQNGARETGDRGQRNSGWETEEQRNRGIEPENRGQRDIRGKSSGDGERRIERHGTEDRDRGNGGQGQGKWRTGTGEMEDRDKGNGGQGKGTGDRGQRTG